MFSVGIAVTIIADVCLYAWFDLVKTLFGDSYIFRAENVRVIRIMLFPPRNIPNKLLNMVQDEGINMDLLADIVDACTFQSITRQVWFTKVKIRFCCCSLLLRSP